MLIAGVDEAGRGCVIGPLVIAGVMVKEEQLPLLIQLGVKDSKLLSPKKREALAAEITRLAEKCLILKLSPREIDQAVECKRRLYKLNRLEAQTMAQIINALKPCIAYVDAADVIEDRFRQHIQECLTVRAAIISRHKADRIYPIVSAASIIAKVERDREIEALKAEYGDFGSGYLADKKTTKFLREWLKTHGEYADCVRKSWKPAKQVRSENDAAQKKLG
ncbi:MAG: ribonuclease HII [Candidatus Bathyarchaeota archaeon]|nr:ribonuclease HII [Candidatus Bathyarchaeota archaeon]